MSKSAFSSIEERVAGHLRNCLPDFRKQLQIVGVSGGPDSMALMYLYHRLGVPAEIVHINYGKRGRESDLDAELTEQMAFQWGFNCHSLRVDASEANGENFQQWARDTRYRIFRDLKKELDAACIATAHHEDDQIETILHKLFRGAGLASWSGMQVWDGEIFRPLLHVSRSELHAWAEKEAVPYRIDASNLESDYARNFIRNEWLPEMKEHFPGWRGNILQAAEQATLFDEAMEELRLRTMDPDQGFRKDPFLSLRPALRRALLLKALKNRDPDISITAGALHEIDRIEELQTGSRLQLTEIFYLLVGRENFSIIKGDEGSFPSHSLDREKLREQPAIVDELNYQVQSFREPDFSRGLFLDADRMQWPLTLRRWQEGDRFQPFGMKGHQSVADHLANRKVAAARKHEALVIVSFEETICAVIFPQFKNAEQVGTIADHVRCDDSTKECLSITQAEAES